MQESYKNNAAQTTFISRKHPLYFLWLFSQSQARPRPNRLGALPKPDPRGPATAGAPGDEALSLLSGDQGSTAPETCLCFGAELDPAPTLVEPLLARCNAETPKDALVATKQTKTASHAEPWLFVG